MMLEVDDMVFETEMLKSGKDCKIWQCRSSYILVILSSKEVDYDQDEGDNP